jgi:hypothetical protein
MGWVQGSEAKRVLNFKEILKDETGMKLAENCNTQASSEFQGDIKRRDGNEIG